MSFINEDKEKKIGIGIFISYKVDTKIMEETINFFDDTKKMPEARIEEIAKIKEYLEKNNISIKDLKETADELLFEKVIGDWEKYANSRYSKGNLGKVKKEVHYLMEWIS
ncbi:TipC family immunity protein [Parvimonas micra]|nr:TipC family immunity protein [Parvimonas micra]WBB33183.1 TipC family immunity protein [Parvimonas micra]WBB34703.1 TipC family immunity protein [Parvimonas micra]WBB36224.1 TipC family immunity protein [Parvimonas micra]